MSSRGTANVLTRATAILAGLFFATSLVLSILAGFERKPTSILNNVGRRRVPGQPSQRFPSTSRSGPAPNQSAGRRAPAISRRRARKPRRGRRCRDRSDVDRGPGDRPLRFVELCRF